MHRGALGSSSSTGRGGGWGRATVATSQLLIASIFPNQLDLTDSPLFPPHPAPLPLSHKYWKWGGVLFDYIIINSILVGFVFLKYQTDSAFKWTVWSERKEEDRAMSVFEPRIRWRRKRPRLSAEEKGADAAGCNWAPSACLFCFLLPPLFGSNSIMVSWY